MVGLHRCALAAVLVLVAGAATSDANDCHYTYRAEITEVYDGDTMTADIDLGLNVWVRDEKMRLARIGP